MSKAPDPRTSSAYRKFRDEFCAPKLGARCWLCGELIHYHQRPRHRLGPSLDHLVPLSRGGSLLDPSNARLAHYGCNCARGNGLSRRGNPRTDPYRKAIEREPFGNDRTPNNYSRKW